MEHETFWTLLHDLAHWEFELFLIFIFDFLLGVVVARYARKFFKHHKKDDDKIAALERQVAELQRIINQQGFQTHEKSVHSDCGDRDCGCCRV